jgi:hypothetical protein
LPTVAPSLRREPAHRSFPKVIEEEDINRILTDYREAARRYKEGGMKVAKIIADSGMIDFINVIKGHIDTSEGISHVIPGMGIPSAPALELAGRVRQVTGLPILHAFRINDVATTRYAVSNGLLDMVGMTRAHIADPHIVKKIINGEEETIRPCVSAGYFIDRIYQGGEALCIHNAATGREAKIPHVIKKSKKRRKLVIVGAGPGGLEAARVSGERGHKVVIYEATPEAGGQIGIAAAVQRRRELVTTSWDILTGQVKPARNVIMYDNNGQHPGLTCAEYLCDFGSSIELVTANRMIAQDIGGTNFPLYYKKFYDNNVVITPNLFLRRVEKKGDKLLATFYNEYTKQEVVKESEQVAVEHGTTPADDVYFDLKAKSYNYGQTDINSIVGNKIQNSYHNPDGDYFLFRIGDAVTSQNIHGAIYDAI